MSQGRHKRTVLESNKVGDLLGDDPEEEQIQRRVVANVVEAAEILVCP
jgi:hypothetical protein